MVRGAGGARPGLNAIRNEFGSTSAAISILRREIFKEREGNKIERGRRRKIIRRSSDGAAKEDARGARSKGGGGGV